MAERRRRSRRKVSAESEVSISIERAGASPIERTGLLVDVSDWGVGLQSSTPLVVGAEMRVWGPGLNGASDLDSARSVQVVYCRIVGDKAYRAGCAFADAPEPEAETGAPDISVNDLYEVLQVNPSADQDTIHRVYRILAQRYHPDNPETGNQSAFQAVLNAHQVLSDPEKRAGYDVRYNASKSLRWEIFDKPSDAEGVEIQKRMRAGILAALYELRSQEPESAGMNVRELEDLLGCPREHLEFPLWYLRRKGLVAAVENGKLEITIDGCDAAEDFHGEGLAPKAAQRKELPAPKEV